MNNLPIAKTITYCDPLLVMNYLRHQKDIVFLDGANFNPAQPYSFISFDPFAFFCSKNGKNYVNDQIIAGNPFSLLKKLAQEYQQENRKDLPPFQGGIVGYFGYELLQHLEKINFNKPDDMHFPDLCIGFYDFTIAFDHRNKQAFIIATGLPESKTEQRIKQANYRITQIENLLKDFKPIDKPISQIGNLSIERNLTQPTYEKTVKQTIDHIYAGDVFQANIAQRFQCKLAENVDKFEIYRILRTQNASPYSAYMQFSNIHLLSSSPECFLRLRGKQLLSKPIKGTYPRSNNPQEDEQAKRFLQQDEKNRAENIMIVDLLRNDFSKICLPHTVEAPKLCEIESFSNVHHLVSTITGELKSNVHPIDAICATFPSGSITGAPKVRAMQIIADLEPSYRGPYCGAHGYIGFNGEMELAITIRSFYINQQQLYFHAGGGIVYDSNPTSEYLESLQKADRLKQTLSR